jgi:ParB family transcriptional regulator, chromosome partitioning protein
VYRQNPVKKASKSSLPSAFQRIEDKLASHFSTRVKLKHHTGNGSGQLTLEYYSVEELNNLLRQMNVPVD